MNVQYDRNLATDEVRIMALLESNDFRRGFGDALLREIAKEMARRFVAENFAEIAALMDPQAIANMSIAEAASTISETLRKKLPDVVRHIHHDHERPPVVLKQGLFGGLKRIG